MQDIVDKNDISHSESLLPIINPSNISIDEPTQYIYAAHKINSRLKTIGKKFNLPVSLTMYVARQAWAGIAKNKNVPISIINKGMGHSSKATHASASHH